MGCLLLAPLLDVAPSRCRTLHTRSKTPAVRTGRRGGWGGRGGGWVGGRGKKGRVVGGGAAAREQTAKLLSTGTLIKFGRFDGHERASHVRGRVIRREGSRAWSREPSSKTQLGFSCWGGTCNDQKQKTLQGRCFQPSRKSVQQYQYEYYTVSACCARAVYPGTYHRLHYCCDLGAFGGHPRRFSGLSYHSQRGISKVCSVK